MKIHITQSYSELSDELKQLQTDYTKIARKLGMTEMGIPDCKNSVTYSPMELSKLLDGIIASVEGGDLVIVQLPTGNGADFEKSLLDRIIVYSGEKPFLLWEDNDYYNMYRKVFFPDRIGRDYVLRETDNEIYEDHTHVEFSLADTDTDCYIKSFVALETIIEHTDKRLFFHILCDDALSDDMKAILKSIAERGSHSLEFYKEARNSPESVKRLWEIDFSSIGLESSMCDFIVNNHSLTENSLFAHEYNDVLTRISSEVNFAAINEGIATKILAERKVTLMKSIEALQK